MRFSGNTAPTLKWFAGDDELEAEDNSEPRIAVRDYTRTVTTDDDRRPFRCVAKLGDLERVCDVIVQVPRKSHHTNVSVLGECQCYYCDLFVQLDCNSLALVCIIENF